MYFFTQKPKDFFSKTFNSGNCLMAHSIGHTVHRLAPTHTRLSYVCLMTYTPQNTFSKNFYENQHKLFYFYRRKFRGSLRILNSNCSFYSLLFIIWVVQLIFLVKRCVVVHSTPLLGCPIRNCVLVCCFLLLLLLLLVNNFEALLLSHSHSLFSRVLKMFSEFLVFLA